MIKSVQLFILASLLFCGPLAAQGVSTPPPQPKAGATVAPNPDTTRIAELERDNAEARYKADIAEMKADILAAQTNWFEILTSSMIGLFGVLITVVVLGLAWKLDKTARSEIAMAKQDMDAQVKEAGKLVKQAREAVAEIEKHKKTAEEWMRGKRIDELLENLEDRKALADLAASAEKKPRNQLSLDDYRALVFDAFSKQNWSQVISWATAMAYVFEDEADDAAMMFTLSQKAYALGELNRHEDAIAAYDDCIARYGGSEDPYLQEQVANALVHKGFNLVTLNRHEDAIAAYDDVIARYGGSEDPDLQEQVASALFNKGVGLNKLNRHEDAITAYGVVIAQYGGSNDPALQKDVANALFNKACSYALTKDEQRCIETLELWAERRGGMDMEAIKNEPDFDGIRNREAFKAFLTKHGA
jgi:tetratricopeptide (TPR) repeat protein